MQISVRNALNLFFTDNKIPKTLSQVAGELGIPIRTLRRYTPDQCKKIAQQHIEFEAQIAVQKEESMINKVYLETTAFLKLGIYPTAAKISSCLPHSAYLQNSKIRSSIEQAVTDFRIPTTK